MELTPRKKAILTAMVRQYILNGEPIGSKILTELLDDAPSSATLRNEMSQLDTMGYLVQPHTSAGRIPTPRAYDFYVNSVLTPKDIDSGTKRIIDETLTYSVPDERLYDTAAELLSELTGMTSLVAAVVDEEIKVKRIEIVPLNAHLLLAAVIMTDGQSRSSMLRTSLDTPALETFKKSVGEKFTGKSIGEFTPALLQNIMMSGNDALTFMPLYTAVFDMISSLGKSRLRLGGEQRLFSDFASTGQAIMSLASRSDGILSLFGGNDKQMNILFGSNTPFRQLTPTTIVAARFGGNADRIGRIGVIGPTRMFYESVIPSVEYTASRLSEIISRKLNDLEE